MRMTVEFLVASGFLVIALCVEVIVFSVHLQHLSFCGNKIPNTNLFFS